MILYAMTQKGVHKSENEDRIVLNQEILSSGSMTLDIDSGIFAIADGVGGNSGGEIASHFVAESLARTSCLSDEVFLSINHALLEEGERQIMPDMATTLTGVFVENHQTTLFSVGNSRVYAIQNGKYLKQLTVDDSVVQLLLSRGQIKEWEVSEFQRRHEITACFGGGNANLFQLKVEILHKPPSIFMMTSDGIHDHVSLDDLEELITTEGISLELCKKIIQLSVKRGSTDDLSILIGVK